MGLLIRRLSCGEKAGRVSWEELGIWAVVVMGLCP
jgi:hypothetical protein